jgi:hypothetical protein
VCKDILCNTFDLLRPEAVELRLQSALDAMVSLDVKLEGFNAYPMHVFCSLLHTQ